MRPNKFEQKQEKAVIFGVMKGLFWVIICGLFIPKVGATTDSTLRYTNAIYEGDIRSIVLRNAGSGFNFPVLLLGAQQADLELSFDQLQAERDYYQVTLVHCDALWRKTSLAKTQCLDGMGFQEVDQVRFSNGTLTPYVHYAVRLPNADMRPKLSGNYLLVVYRNYDEADIVFSRRIMVLQSKGNVQVDISQSSQVEFRQQQQQINFTFNKTTSNYFMPNPFRDITSLVLQNGDWNTAISNLKPQFIKNESFIYNQMLGSQFWGNNEFRFFDIRSLQTAAAGVKKRDNIGGQKHVWLISDRSRGFDAYTNWKDYNGRVYYDNRDVPSNKPVESDYCFVHFSLFSEPLDKEVYVYGEMSDWRILESHKMYYNTESKQYEAVIPLKQGFYNYMYGVREASTDSYLNFISFEGSHSVSENNYMVLIYHRNPVLPYDELIGYGLNNSQPNR